MSADNRVCYMQDSNGEWAVWNGGGSQDYSEPPDSAVRFDAEKEAQDYAHAYEASMCICEYGVSPISKEEQIKALAWEIQFRAERLDRLMRTGCQWKQLRSDDDWPYTGGGLATDLPTEAGS